VLLFLRPVSRNEQAVSSWNKLVEQFADKPVNFVWIANEAEESLTHGQGDPQTDAEKNVASDDTDAIPPRENAGPPAPWQRAGSGQRCSPARRSSPLKSHRNVGAKRPRRRNRPEPKPSI
jgi:hypothetical protein